MRRAGQEEECNEVYDADRVIVILLSVFMILSKMQHKLTKGVSVYVFLPPADLLHTFPGTDMSTVLDLWLFSED